MSPRAKVRSRTAGRRPPRGSSRGPSPLGFLLLAGVAGLSLGVIALQMNRESPAAGEASSSVTQQCEPSTHTARSVLPSRRLAARGVAGRMSVTVQETPSPEPRQRPVPARPTEGPTVPAGSRVALTLDAGASAEPGEKILQTLREHGVTCTVFVTGQFVSQNPDLVRRIVADGNELGNHTWRHRDLRTLKDAEILDELRRTEDEVQRICGVSTRPYYRAPYGARNARVLRVTSSDGWEEVFWTVDSWDAFKKNITPAEITERVLSRVRPGAVLLCHIGSEATAEALPGILDELAKRGYQVGPLSRLGSPIPR